MLNDSAQSVKDMYAKLENVKGQLLSERMVNTQLSEKIALKQDELEK